MKPLLSIPTGYAFTSALRCGVLVGCVALLAGCRTFSPDGGMGPVAGFIGGTLNKELVAVQTPEDEVRARGIVEGLLKRPLTADAAVQVALLNNRGLQANYNELGMAEAVMIANSRPPVPTFSISNVSTPLELDIERQIVVAILGLVTQPARSRIAADRFAQAQLRAASATLRVAAETRRAYYRAVAAAEVAVALASFNSAAENSAELAKQLGKTGALNQLDQARQQVFYADLTAQLATARQQTMVEREQLVRLMGLWGRDLDFRLPNALPRLPPKPQTLPTIEQDAMDHRADLQIARIEVETLAKSYGLTRKTHFINVLDASGIAKTQKDKGSGPAVDGGGIAIEFQVPIFDFGRPRVREAEQRYMQAVNFLAEQAVNARSEAREAYRSYRATYDIAGHYRREVLPLRQIIFDQSKLQANAMLIDVFSLLTEARERIAANINGIEARRNFWLASADLNAVILGGGHAGTQTEGSVMAAASGAMAGQ
ncbi:MAG: TolC family protein [Methyloceanibacter sp.]